MIDYTKFEIDSKDRYFLGIDQSLTNTGVVLFDKYENEIILSKTISTEKFDILDATINPIELRLYYIIKEVEKVIINNKVDVVCIEGLAFDNKTNNARQLSGLFFGLIIMFMNNNVKYFVIAPKSLKFVSTKDGNANKENMLAAIDYDTVEKLRILSGFSKITKKFYDIVDAYHLSKYMILKDLNGK